MTLSYETKSRDGRLHVVNDALGAPFNTKGVQVVTLMDPETGVPITDFGADGATVDMLSEHQIGEFYTAPDGDRGLAIHGVVNPTGSTDFFIFNGGYVPLSLQPSGLLPFADTNQANLADAKDAVESLATGQLPNDHDVTVTESALPTDAATQTTLEAVRVLLEVLDDWDESDRAKVNPIVGQAGVAAGADDVDALTQRVTLADDDPAVAGIQAMVQALLLADESTFATLYQYDSTLDATPDTGDVQFDAASSAIGNVTTLYFNDTDDLGSTASVRDRVQNGTIIYLRAQSDDHKYAVFVATGDGTDTTGEWSVAVSAIGRGRVDLADDDVCVCYFARLGDAPSLQAQASINEVWYSGAKYTVETAFANASADPTVLVTAPGAGFKTVLLKAHASGHGTTDVVFEFEDEAGAISHEIRVAGSGGGGEWGLFLECAENDALRVANVSGSNADLGVTVHYITAAV